MSNTQTNDKTKEENSEDRKVRLKAKLSEAMKRKKLGRMNKHQKKLEVDKYCDQLGITSEQIEQFKEMGKQLEKLKNSVPYR